MDELGVASWPRRETRQRNLQYELRMLSIGPNVCSLRRRRSYPNTVSVVGASSHANNSGVSLSRWTHIYGDKLRTV